MPIPVVELERAVAEQARIYAFFKEHPGLAWSDAELRAKGFDPSVLKPSGSRLEMIQMLYYWHPEEKA